MLHSDDVDFRLDETCSARVPYVVKAFWQDMASCSAFLESISLPQTFRWLEKTKCELLRTSRHLDGIFIFAKLCQEIIKEMGHAI